MAEAESSFRELIQANILINDYFHSDNSERPF